MPANEINILNMRNEQLLDISRKYLLSLDLDEMKVIRDYFRKEKRNPRNVELEMIAQTWSEHCKHKTITSKVEYRYKGRDGSSRKRIYRNLLKETVFKVTKELNRKWCVSVFKDNAGIVEFDRTRCIAFKVETHNHPSALEPYGGAGTGIGGVIRDILGVGLGAKPVMNTDVFCFGPLDLPYEKIPDGVLHPKRVFSGVVCGVRDYGNRMGIPTANGAILFDEGYIYNPLVYCGTIGILPRNKAFKSIKPGDLILAVGGRTGRDGIHGATFSSLSLDKDTGTGAVQIGNPIVEKKVLDTILQARDRNLYRAITDCGAGGFSSAVGELALFSGGARVHLEHAPLKYDGLLAWEIWLSESQERMVLAVPPEKKEALLKIFQDEDVEATVLGEFTDTGRLQVLYGDDVICDLDMDFLHEGLPKRVKKAVSLKRPERTGLTGLLKINGLDSIEGMLKKKLSDLNTASKEWVIRQ
ncbi:MAG: AIR synthase-related protein, partial [bacterium]|nr:AIR synthase-related protein [bacterium]